MTDNNILSPDMEELPASVAALFKESSEARHKGISAKDNFKHTRRQIIDLLLAHRRRTAARAPARSSIKLRNGDNSRTILALPPGWFKLKDWDRRRLEKCGNANKFLFTLRRMLAAKRRALESPRRSSGENSQSPMDMALRRRIRKVRWRRVLSDSPPINDSAVSSSPSGSSNQDTGSTEKEGNMGDIKEPAKIKEPTAHASDHDEPMESGNGEAVAESVGKTPPGAEENKCGAEAGAKTKEDAHETADEVKENPIEGEAKSDEIGALEQNGGTGDQTDSVLEDFRRAQLINRVFGSSVPSDIDSENETDSEDEDEDKDMGGNILLNSDPTSQESPSGSQSQLQAEKAPTTSTEIMDKVTNLATEITGVDSSSWDDYKPILVEHLHELGLGRAAPSAPLDPKIAGSPVNRFKTALTLLGAEVAKVPVRPWVAYQKKLTAFCASPRISAMDTAQRLEEIRTILYLGEEEHAIKRGEWERAENAVRMCAVLAVATGSEGDNAQEVADQWMKSRLRDIVCVRRLLQAASSARSAETRPGPEVSESEA